MNVLSVGLFYIVANRPYVFPVLLIQVFNLNLLPATTLARGSEARFPKPLWFRKPVPAAATYFISQVFEPARMASRSPAPCFPMVLSI